MPSGFAGGAGLGALAGSEEDTGGLVTDAGLGEGCGTDEGGGETISTA